jgi:hypothetical protein
MFGGPSWDQMKLKGAADRVAEEYGIGSSVTVHYDASKPQRAVLEPGIAFSSYMYLVIGGALLANGAAGLLPR